MLIAQPIKVPVMRREVQSNLIQHDLITLAKLLIDDTRINNIKCLFIVLPLSSIFTLSIIFAVFDHHRDESRVDHLISVCILFYYMLGELAGVEVSIDHITQSDVLNRLSIVHHPIHILSIYDLQSVCEE